MDDKRQVVTVLNRLIQPEFVVHKLSTTQSSAPLSALLQPKRAFPEQTFVAATELVLHIPVLTSKSAQQLRLHDIASGLQGYGWSTDEENCPSRAVYARNAGL